MLLIENASWLRDHQIEDNVIFPCAGYISMVGEGIRQISGAQDSFTLRNVVLSSALVLSEDAPTELVTTFRPVRLTDSLNSQWWDFTIASHNGNIWMKHCTGQVASEKVEPVRKPGEDLLPRKSFLARAKKDTSILSIEESVNFLAQEIGKKLFVFLLKSPENLDTSVSLAPLGMDSLVGVEMRGWWRQTFGFDISVLELLGMGNLDGLGRHAAEGVMKLLAEEQP
ncbi:polyketide synthase dehydratase-domain-containing protein [Aspergillus navahoensis]